jgi:DNA-binding response OmpR family regulator
MSGSIQVDELLIDLEQHIVRWGQQELLVSEQELGMMATLASEFGRACSFEELARVSGSSYLGDADRVRSAVKRLRAKLGSAGVQVRIVAVPGFGFRLAQVNADREAG